ncbi:hypothetical protein IVA80_07570 [Bradyrhizobium sp. 139]|uniref:hypothetical protein n=1 Tax=Bradyrhizobium sp. 139 TaxID=2782616 RepID=UPI001FF90420|nr:hypothetical protein [Bradyrhizobium sp. 139]MCK1740735.1 hypothetical protein [Bradyrhizobium sp. 139]
MIGLMRARPGSALFRITRALKLRMKSLMHQDDRLNRRLKQAEIIRHWTDRAQSR